MTFQDILQQLNKYPSFVLGYYFFIALLLLTGYFVVKPTRFKPPINYLYTILIYLVTIPGLLSILLVLYHIFFLRGNILKLPLLTHFVPIVMMLFTFWGIKKTIPMRLIPGFDRLSGLFVFLFFSFLLTYFLHKVYVGIFFIGSISHIAVFFGLVLFGLRFVWKRLSK